MPAAPLTKPAGFAAKGFRGNAPLADMFTVVPLAMGGDARTVNPNHKIVKGMTMRGPGFYVPVQYKLEDGRVIASDRSTTRKKDLPADIERTRRHIARGFMSANFDDNGKFWGVVTSMSFEDIIAG